MDGKIFIKIGSTFGSDDITGEYKTRKKHECTGGMKQQFVGKDSSFVCLVGYDIEKLHPYDLKIIKKHVTRKTADGTQYYEFTRDKTLNEIRAEKTMFLSDSRKRHHYVDKENSVFSPATMTVHVPEKIIPAHDEEKGFWWNCSDDSWAEDAPRL